MARTARGVGSTLPVAVTAGGQLVGTTSHAFSFDGPVSLKYPVSPSHFNMPISGAVITGVLNEAIGFLGGDLGPWDVTLRVRFGGTAARATRWLSNATMVCRMAAGVGALGTVVVTAAVQARTALFALSYDRPNLTTPLSQLNLPSGQGSTPLVLLHTSNGGIPWGLASVRGRVGGSACESSMWVSESTVVCRAGFGGIGGNFLALVLTVAHQRGTAMPSLSFDTPELKDAFSRNDAARGGAEALLSGSSFGAHAYSAIGGRIGFTACEVSRWLSDSMLACRVPAGVSRPRIPIVVSVGGISGARSSLSEAFTFDTPRFTAVGMETSLGGGANQVNLQGQNFGTVDMSLAGRLGKEGCIETLWLSDSSLACTLSIGSSAATIPAAVVREGRLCRRCLQSQVLVGCSDDSAGFCTECQPCPRGEYREACIPGTESPGRCMPCPGEGLPDGQRFFKPRRGAWSDLCLPCTMCGGPNHNGTAFEVARCSVTADSQCQACAPCSSGVRIGCAESDEGVCVTLDAEHVIRATASAPINALFSNTTSSVTLVTHRIELPGAFAGTSIEIPAGTRVTTRSPADRIVLSVVSPSSAMLEAIALQQNASSSGLGLILLGSPLFLYPSGARFDPPVTLSYPVNGSVSRSARSALQNRSRTALFRWDSAAGSWLEVPGSAISSAGIIAAPTNSFSFYAAFETSLPPPNVSLGLVLSLTGLALLVVLFAACWIHARSRASKETALPAMDMSRREDPRTPGYREEESRPEKDALVAVDPAAAERFATARSAFLSDDSSPISTGRGGPMSFFASPHPAETTTSSSAIVLPTPLPALGGVSAPLFSPPRIPGAIAGLPRGPTPRHTALHESARRQLPIAHRQLLSPDRSFKSLQRESGLQEPLPAPYLGSAQV